ncbi:MAG TPA: D-glucuronyl C5-epimerase family protein [Alphaproteobacteria bacterium]|nr:D-glucuronyl C5-epimerase family protein [Alphaproteobacteria bacterium]
MLTTLGRAWGLFDNYLLAPAVGRPSTAGFWYLPEPPRVADAAALAGYLAAGHPPYLIDYRPKLRYRLVGPEGIVVLPYGGAIGTRINPEAAFQYALGLHDAWLATGDPEHRRRFLHYAAFFLGRQTAEGDWTYDFDWYENRAPWASALAQARGASVMLRAGRLDPSAPYFDAARRALSRFSRPVERGGYAARFEPAGCVYFEEYPKQGNVTLNGFMASLFGLFEAGRLLGDPGADALWREGTASLLRMLPHFETGWWTLYDRDPRRPQPNPHSPRYHRMCVGYLSVLAAISGDPGLAAARDRWRALDRLPNRSLAFVQKARRKILYR